MTERKPAAKKAPAKAPAKKAPAKKAAADKPKSTVAEAQDANPADPRLARAGEDTNPADPAVTGPQGAEKDRGDFTGAQASQDRAKNYDELRARSNEISMLNPLPPVPNEDTEAQAGTDAPGAGNVTEHDADGEAIDYTGDGPTSEKERQEREEANRLAEEQQVVEYETAELEGEETVRIKHTVTNMVYGHGNVYDFEAGRRYKVDRHLARHLRAKGIAWPKD